MIHFAYFKDFCIFAYGQLIIAKWWDSPKNTVEI